MNIFWFRRDLRLDDNAALNRALEAGEVYPIFIFDTNILDALTDPADRRVSFIYDHIRQLKATIEAAGGTLHVYHGSPENIFSKLVREYTIDTVYAGRDYEPYARQRDDAVANLLDKASVRLCLVQDHVIFEPDSVVKADGLPYTVYTPYMRAWRRRYQESGPPPVVTGDLRKGLMSEHTSVLPALQDIGFTEVDHRVPEPEMAPDLIRRYDRDRDYPALDGVSHVGPHLRFGTLSIRQLVLMGMDINETWTNQLIWREFFIQVLWHFPHTATQSFRPAYDNLVWHYDEQAFRRWKEGKTGFPLVDAGMRQLLETGYMHNRVRMVTANFLTRLMLMDWRKGEAWFAEKLLDYEMANNVGGWQWCSGSGCDAAPYFRIFNPDAQISRFDAKLEYVRRWIPEFDTPSYPAPMLDYRAARARALAFYKDGLNQQ